MLFYDFLCVACKKPYVEFTSYDPTGKYKSVKCPHCNSKKKNKLISQSNFTFADPTGTSKMESFSYRAGHNMEKAKAERRRAEEKSHMGTDIYNPIDDLNVDKNWGEVK